MKCTLDDIAKEIVFIYHILYQVCTIRYILEKEINLIFLIVTYFFFFFNNRSET